MSLCNSSVVAHAWLVSCLEHSCDGTHRQVCREVSYKHAVEQLQQTSVQELSASLHRSYTHTSNAKTLASLQPFDADRQLIVNYVSKHAVIIVTIR